jgi:micrococcal nuclease
MVQPMRRRRRLLVLVLVVTAAAGACSTGAGRGPPADEAVVPVTKVTDGDTIHVTYHGRDERIRLIGVDTPEVSWYGGHGECFGEQAGQYSRGRLAGRTVRLEFDVDLRDRYERLLAYVYLGQELFNVTLVKLGYASADPVPPDTARASEFAAAEQEARAAGRGLWSACPSSIP